MITIKLGCEMDIRHEEGLRITGHIKCVLKNIETGEEIIFETPNLVTTVGKTMVAKRLANEGNDCNITCLWIKKLLAGGRGRRD